MQAILEKFLENLRNTGWMEYTAVIAGILSVWFSRIENVLVYPVGLINTTLYVYLTTKESLYGEASVNLYYTIMSVYGWILWTKRNEKKQLILHVTYSSK